MNFPRVLFVTPVAFNPFTGGGATFTSLFAGWPKDRLATIHNDIDPTTNDVCEKYFVLGSDELDLIAPFRWFRRQRRSSEQSQNESQPANVSQAAWTDRAREFLLADSIPERTRLTPELQRWIADFRPELIYTILGSNGMMALIDSIRSQFHLPLVVHIMDDWATSAHRRGLLAPMERVRMNKWLSHFFAQAESCFGISPAMCEVYSKRYGRPFTAFQYALDVDRWESLAKRDLASARPPEFLYVGSIFADAQLGSLIDCTRAISELNREGFPSKLRIVTSPRYIARFRHLLEPHPNVTLSASDFDEAEFFGMLARADALFLPVNFGQHSIDLLRYSMPTKVPSYLASGTPVLVYGPPQTAQVQYARDAGWGHVIAERSIPALKAGIRRIVDDLPLRQKLSAAAHKASANHDAKIVRAAFQRALCDAAGASSSGKR